MNIKNKIIKWLGGYPPDDDKLTRYKPVRLCCETKNYYIDDDSIEFEKNKLAGELGELLLEEGCISYTIKEQQDNLGGKIYTIRGKVCVNKER